MTRVPISPVAPVTTTGIGLGLYPLDEAVGEPESLTPQVWTLPSRERREHNGRFAGPPNPPSQRRPVRIGEAASSTRRLLSFRAGLSSGRCPTATERRSTP